MSDQNPQPSKLVIRAEDLDDVPIVAPAPGPAAYAAPVPPTTPLPRLSVSAPAITVTTGPASPVAKLGANSVVSGLLAGLVGGVLGMVVAEVLHNPDNVDATTDAGMRATSGLWVAIFGAVLGFVLMAWDGFTSESPAKGLRDGAMGAAIGAAAGFVGGWTAQWLYSEMLKGLSFDSTLQDIKSRYLVARTVAWGLFGVLLGLGIGIRGGKRKIVNGVIGGVVGGAVGGLLFQLFAQQAIGDGQEGGPSPFVLRFVGLVLTGVGIGLAIGLVERLRRDAWLLISAGPMAGKEFILYQDRTVIGADYHNDIVLVKDASILSHHLTLTRTGTAVDLMASGPVAVNGMPVTQHRLRSGDQIVVGASALTFQERAIRAA